MTNHPNRTGAVLSSRARAAFPGDQVRVMTGRHEDAWGQFWPAGTEYSPIGAGVDNTLPGSPNVQTVTIKGQTVRFLGAGTVNPAR